MPRVARSKIIIILFYFFPDNNKKYHIPALTPPLRELVNVTPDHTLSSPTLRDTTQTASISVRRERQTSKTTQKLVEPYFVPALLQIQSTHRRRLLFHLLPHTQQQFLSFSSDLIRPLLPRRNYFLIDLESHAVHLISVRSCIFLTRLRNGLSFVSVGYLLVVVVRGVGREVQG